VSTTQLDWREIVNDREKYAAYLCSREWAEKREAVRERAGNRCERCRVLPMDACHHLTYERKYNERLEDLAAVCEMCHGFTHGKSEFDPAANSRITQYLLACQNDSDLPIPTPLWAMVGGGCSAPEEILVCAIRQLQPLMDMALAGSGEACDPIEEAMILLSSHLPWNYYSAVCFQIEGPIPEYEAALTAFGFGGATQAGAVDE